MIHIEQAIVVEGKYDKIKLTSILDAVIIVTNGFRIYKDKDKINLIRRYAETTGVIILTDSDTAGFKIRNHLKSVINHGKIINVYIPDIFGKEKRKSEPSKEGKLGVEGIDKEILFESFKKAGVLFSEKKPQPGITRMDLYTDGFIGSCNSTEKRRKLLKLYDLPEKLSTNGILEILNNITTFDDYKIKANAINGIGEV